MTRLDHLWYTSNALAYALAPLAGLYCAAVWCRRKLYEVGLLSVNCLPVPVIVVGNITVGGTGKTPLVIWLARFLIQNGFRPGIVSRGYAGRARDWPQQVRADSDPLAVGDEAVLIARRTGCPMSVGPDRVAAAAALLRHNRCDFIVSDDGLQHYPLYRDIEIAVIDGQRRFGNGLCLPAGPLRETPARLRRADMIVTNGSGDVRRREFSMRIEPGAVVSVRDGLVDQPLEAFRGRAVHAVAGIGNPQRFFDILRRGGLQPLEHVFPDHHIYRRAEICPTDDLPVLMTEKDAVKCQGLADERHWYVQVDATPELAFKYRLGNLLKELTHGQTTSRDSGMPLV